MSDINQWVNKQRGNFGDYLLSDASSYSLFSSDYKMVGDNSADNIYAIEGMIAAANAAVAAGFRVKLVLRPGVYRTSGRHTAIHGDVDIVFDNAQIIATGSNVSAPVMTHGMPGMNSKGSAAGIYISASGLPTNAFHNRNCVGFRSFNKNIGPLQIRTISGFAIGLQVCADVSWSYGEIQVGEISACKTAVEFNSMTVGTPFISENALIGGNILPTTGAQNYGSVFGWVITREYDTGYGGNSGNKWYKPSFQMLGPGRTWAASTNLSGLPAGTCYYMASSGQEWMLKTPGSTSTTEPSVIPSVVAGTRVDLTAITTVAGSAQIAVSSTAGISAGWHTRGNNPLSNFPFDTYVVSVDDGTHLTLSNAAASNSSTYKATFVAPVIDGSAAWVYVGPYRRSCLWMRDCGANNAIDFARRESGTGEAILASGPYLWPFSATINNQTYEASLTAESSSVNTAKDNRFPVWAANTVYALGDQVRPSAVTAYFFECIAAGTSAGSEPTPAQTNVNFTFVDSGATWIIRAMPDSTTRGDIGIYTGVNFEPLIYPAGANQVVGNTVQVDNLNQRAIGSASGFIVMGAVKCTTTGVLSQSFSTSDLILARDGLLLGNTSSSQIGVLLRTKKAKLFRFGRLFGSYASHRGVLCAFDKGLQKINSSTGQYAYNTRIQTKMAPSGAFEFTDPADGDTSSRNFLVGPDVEYVFLGFYKGATGTPVACTLSGFSITALPFDTIGALPLIAEIFPLFGMFTGPRASLGTPTVGYFKSLGEFIQNASVASGNPKGWFVTTAGILAPAWAGSAVYLKGQLVSAGGNIYAANGSFTSNSTPTAPSGTTQNILDANATSIVSGDVASWDYMGPVAVLTADENLP